MLLDRDEFEYHQVLMDYDPDIIEIVENEQKRLVNLVRSKWEPFNDSVINDYFDKYLSLGIEEEI